MQLIKLITIKPLTQAYYGLCQGDNYVMGYVKERKVGSIGYKYGLEARDDYIHHTCICILLCILNTTQNNITILYVCFSPTTKVTTHPASTWNGPYVQICHVPAKVNDKKSNQRTKDSFITTSFLLMASICYSLWKNQMTDTCSATQTYNILNVSPLTHDEHPTDILAVILDPKLQPLNLNILSISPVCCYCSHFSLLEWLSLCTPSTLSERLAGPPHHVQQLHTLLVRAGFENS